MKLITVLKTSETYKKDHVHLIHEQLEKFNPGTLEFICLSDDSSVPGFVPLKHNWPSWWSKIEMFNIQGPCLYLDLDTIIISNMNTILKQIPKYKFICLRDFYKNPKMERTIASGIMSWNGDMSFLYEKFKEKPEEYISMCNTDRWWGDQGYIEMMIGSPSVYFQDILPKNTIVSWKAHCREKGYIPKEASIIAFHGNPKPWDVNINKMRKL